MDFDIKRASLKGADFFKRFQVTGKGVPLRDTGLSENTLLLVFERSGVRLAFLLQQMIYHHVAQGEVNGEPYLVTF